MPQNWARARPIGPALRCESYPRFTKCPQPHVTVPNHAVQLD